MSLIREFAKSRNREISEYHALVQDRWNAAEAPRELLDQLVYQSRLVGAEESLVLWGGGNNSVKVRGSDPLGAPLDLMFVKGSGSDMKSIVASEYPGVRLDYVRALLNRDRMADDEMVDYLGRALIDPKSRRPSIETLLHGFLSATAVLHTHADAILAITNTRGREATVHECFGNAVVTVPYLRPGFALSKLVADVFARNPGLAGLVLMNHGLITWGDTPEQAYRRHIELVTRAEDFVAQRSSQAGIRESESRPAASRRQTAPVLRGMLGRKRRMVLEFDGSPEVLRFLERSNVSELARRGPATPDHLLYTKRFPVVLADGADVRHALEQHAADYDGYFSAHAHSGESADALPRVILVPGTGMWTVGRDARAARIVHDIYRHTISIMTAAESIGGFATLSEKDAFEAEYWPLELYKLTLLPKDKELAGHVAVVTGAAGAIGSAIARRLASEGAHVVVTDIRGEVQHIADEIARTHGAGRALGVEADVTDESHVRMLFEKTIDAFGGVDVVVTNAGIAHVSPLDELATEQWNQSLAINATAHFLVARETIRLMKLQGIGGSIVFIATKNVTAPGKDFGAYSVAKAAEAQLCRIAAIEGGEFGIRANMINPDAVFAGSGLWSEEVRRKRADAHGLKLDELPDFYRRRNLLQAEVTAEDVAEAALFLASARSAKTTGAMIPVDGGVREAFPR